MSRRSKPESAPLITSTRPTLTPISNDHTGEELCRDDDPASTAGRLLETFEPTTPNPSARRFPRMPPASNRRPVPRCGAPTTNTLRPTATNIAE